MIRPTQSKGRYHYLRASTHAVEPEIRDAIIVNAHVELCPIKYSNLNSIILKRFLETLVLVFIGFLKFLLITLLL